ncbi:MAG: glycosyltransferase, partial [Myxococcaceae bacterium]|nr:glycosyltransferase [Myxococcaceae bacterium]
AVSEGLAARGESVTVWAPGCSPELPGAHGPRVCRLPQGFSVPGLLVLGGVLERSPRPARLLVQYVPHAFGRGGLNVVFAAWLAVQRRAELWVMFHEVSMPWSWGPGGLQAGIQRVMAAMLARRARRIFVSTPAWAPRLTMRRGGVALEWLPVPSNVIGPAGETAREAARSRVPGEAGAPVVGHFGTFGEGIGGPLHLVLRLVAEAHPTVRFMLLGRGSRTFHARLLRDVPTLTGRIIALGGLPPEELAPHLAACDLMLQPYPDGVTTRRGTAMAALALGRPLVTNAGSLTEPVWRSTEAVLLAARPEAGELARAVLRLLSDPGDEWRRRAEAARRLYGERFELRHTLDRLLSAARRTP